ncbi:MAG: hypothetical protein ACLQVG_26065 [Terriglobia bacterium]|jgi:hypothetical protein
MSKQEEAALILKLYELGKDDSLRKARDWYFRDFHPHSIANFNEGMFSEHSGQLRALVSYWDMAAALVNDGAVSLELFNSTFSEHIVVFAKIEPMLQEIRDVFAPHFAANVEKLIDATPGGRKLVAKAQERIKATH